MLAYMAYNTAAHTQAHQKPKYEIFWPALQQKAVLGFLHTFNGVPLIPFQSGQSSSSSTRGLQYLAGFSNGYHRLLWVKREEPSGEQSSLTKAMGLDEWIIGLLVSEKEGVSDSGVAAIVSKFRPVDNPSENMLKSFVSLSSELSGSRKSSIGDKELVTMMKQGRARKIQKNERMLSTTD